MTIEYVPQKPDFLKTIDTLQGGVVAEMASRLLADVAMATCEYGDGKRKGKFTLTIDVAKGKGEDIVEIKHTLSYKHPTAKGSKAEDVADEQVLYINKKGALTAVPDTKGEYNFAPSDEETA